MTELSFQLDYARSDRGSCKFCNGGMEKGELRLGKEGKSRFHDGVDVKWGHFNCVCGNSQFTSKKISQLKGWEKLRWDDILLLREYVDDDVAPSAEEEAKIKMEI